MPKNCQQDYLIEMPNFPVEYNTTSRQFKTFHRLLSSAIITTSFSGMQAIVDRW
jgi:hypothetical protein